MALNPESSQPKPVSANKKSLSPHFKQAKPPLGALKIPAPRLDFAAAAAQKQWRVFPELENFYADWRLRCGAASVLRDRNDLPPERLLQAVWQHQRLRRDQLRTADARVVRVLHPGFASAEGGPDFRGAVVQIGEDAPRCGDVEVDLRASGWHAHGHDCNPNFQNVILHVVWNEVGVHASACRDSRVPDKLKRELQPSPPTLAISDKLDAPLAELGLWLETESPRALPENLCGRCLTPLRQLNEARMAELLHAAARVRFQAKAAQFHARARHAGWEQVLWEGLFRALGYKHNVWPMQNLAESRRRWVRATGSAFGLQARLFGISSLLPAELARLRPAARGSDAAGRVPQKGMDGYVRKLWDVWWREREEFSDCILPPAAWHFHGLRPANQPQRRLALAAHWLADKKLISKIENWSVAEISNGRASRPRGHADRQVSPTQLVDSLREILEVERDEFWSWHWTFQSLRLKKPQPLLGAARITDLAVNVILPWLWTRAAEGKNERLQQVIESRYFAWPRAGDNSVLKLARQRLLGGPPGRALPSAAAQQGLMQIVRDFCEHSNAVCENCRFPELMGGWSNRGSGYT